MTESKTAICAITGHRFRSLPFGNNEADVRCQALRAEMRSAFVHLIENDHVQTFLCGMALGSDQIAAEILIQLKAVYPFLMLHAYVPCQEQCQKWNAAQIARYRALLKQMDEIICLGETYTPWCMQRRNRTMVDRADILFAIYNGVNKGGTASTVQYAARKQKTIRILNPNEL